MKLYKTTTHLLLLDTQQGPIAPTDYVGNTYNGYTKKDFDTIVLFMIAAFLCGLILAVITCALRYSGGIAFESPQSTVARIAVIGLKKSKLQEIPVAVYGVGTNIPATDCPICLGEFMDGEKLRVLPKCQHGFHVRCIDIRLASHSSCPTCRRSLLALPT